MGAWRCRGTDSSRSKKQRWDPSGGRLGEPIHTVLTACAPAMQPLRDSLVWKLQRDFYSSVNVKVRAPQRRLWRGSRGLNLACAFQAWSKAIVPNFVTSNSFIAKAYARVVFKFARDWFRNPNAARDQPIYVVEVGSGHGKLGFLLAKQLAQFAEFLPDMECSPPIKVRRRPTLCLSTLTNSRRLQVVITDFEERDVEFWSQHEPLQHLIEAGWIDTAVFDAEGDTKVRAGAVEARPASHAPAAAPSPLCR